jgi:hypothetical protein
VNFCQSLLETQAWQLILKHGSTRPLPIDASGISTGSSCCAKIGWRWNAISKARMRREVSAQSATAHGYGYHGYSSYGSYGYSYPSYGHSYGYGYPSYSYGYDYPSYGYGYGHRRSW